MSDSILVALIALFGGGGAWQYVRISEANRALARQSATTVKAKDREIKELREENDKLWSKNDRLNRRNDDLMDILTRPEKGGVSSDSSTGSEPDQPTT